MSNDMKLIMEEWRKTLSEITPGIIDDPESASKQASYGPDDWLTKAVGLFLEMVDPIGITAWDDFEEALDNFNKFYGQELDLDKDSDMLSVESLQKFEVALFLLMTAIDSIPLVALLAKPFKIINAAYKSLASMLRSASTSKMVSSRSKTKIKSTLSKLDDKISRIKKSSSYEDNLFNIINNSKFRVRIKDTGSRTAKILNSQLAGGAVFFTAPFITGLIRRTIFSKLKGDEVQKQESEVENALTSIKDMDINMTKEEVVEMLMAQAEIITLEAEEEAKKLNIQFDKEVGSFLAKKPGETEPSDATKRMAAKTRSRQKPTDKSRLQQPVGGARKMN
jgi:hypothetical protein